MSPLTTMIQICVLPSKIVVLQEKSPFLRQELQNKYKNSCIEFLPKVSSSSLETQVSTNRHAYFTCMFKRQKPQEWSQLTLWGKKNWFWGWLREKGKSNQTLIKQAWTSVKGNSSASVLGTVDFNELFTPGIEERLENFNASLFELFLDKLKFLVENPLPLQEKPEEPYLRDSMPYGYWEKNVQCAQKNTAGQTVNYYVFHSKQQHLENQRKFLLLMLKTQRDSWEKDDDRTYFIPFTKIEETLQRESGGQQSSMVLAFHNSTLVGCVVGTYSEAEYVVTTESRPANVCVTMCYIHRRIGMQFGTDPSYTIYQVSNTGGGLAAFIAYLQSMLLNSQDLLTVQIKSQQYLLNSKIPQLRRMSKEPFATVLQRWGQYQKEIEENKIGVVSRQSQKLFVTFWPQQFTSVTSTKEIITKTAKLLTYTFSSLFPTKTKAFRFTATFKK